MDLLISAVNEANLGWTADVCKYQKHHALYGDHCSKDIDEMPVSLTQISDVDDDDSQDASQDE